MGRSNVHLGIARLAYMSGENDRSHQLWNLIMRIACYARWCDTSLTLPLLNDMYLVG
jgi:hypothetical protein